ncbi:hypothetical protein [Glycomyces paridis]|uniref:PH domain-containing protein n=1 Tax=Glycomyces paridis TaxID=2126555 RepID=A0A4S8P7J9_9ACTN|nr:hypothetical protein [Glycomyces paridis]THV26220.1 hypothetical protein E9998_19160 [Glycomyces paridis]
MADLRPDAVFGALRYRHPLLIQIMFPAIAAVLLLIGFMPTAPGERDATAFMLVFCGLLALFYVLPWVRRVDVAATTREGLVLRPLFGSRTVTVSWSHVEAVVVWSQGMGLRKQTFIGVERSELAPQLPHEVRQGRLSRGLNRALLPVGVELANASVMSGRMDYRALATLLAQASAQVPVVDARRSDRAVVAPLEASAR